MRHAFADCILDTDRHVLTRGGEVVEVEPQVFDLIALLVANAGLLVTKDQLVQEIWDGRIVSESAMSARIAAARRAVGDDGKRQSVIRTVSRKGVQLVADVTLLDPAQPTSEAAPENRLALPPKPAVKFARADDGTMLAYRMVGQGPPLVLIEHFPATMEGHWAHPWSTPLLARLCAHNTVIVFDQRGCGLSPRTLTDDDFRAGAGDIAAIATAAGYDRFSVFGRSGGAVTTMLCAADHPDRIKALILQGSYARGRLVRDARDGDKPSDSIEAMQREGWASPGNAFIASYVTVYFPDADAEGVKLAAERLRVACSAENTIAARRWFNHVEITTRLPAIQAPTLVMHSARDSVHPLPEAQIVAAGIRGAELIVFDSANHYVLPHEADWDAQNRAICDHLARHS